MYGAQEGVNDTYGRAFRAGSSLMMHLEQAILYSEYVESRYRYLHISAGLKHNVPEHTWSRYVVL